MSWNNGGPNSSGGGGSGGGSRPGSGNDSGGGSGDGNRPASPWGNPGGARPERPQRPPGGGGPRGPWGGGGGGGGGQPPDLDELIARLQAFLRGFIPPGFGGGGGPRSGGGSSFPAKRSVLLVVVVALVLWGATGFYRVQPDEQGVVLRFGAYNRTTFPGLNYHIPWPVESVLTPAVTRVNRVEIGYRSQDSGSSRGAQSARDVTSEGLMLTGDENIVDINFTVFWRIRDAGAYLFATRNPAATVKSAAESEMREVIGRTPIQPALTDARASIEASVKKGVQAMMDQYGSGVEITQVQLQKVDPPAAVIESFRDVQRAQTDAERLQNEADTYRNDIVPRARGDAARLIAEADADRQVSVTKATGETERFLSVLKSYDLAKDVTMKRLYLETMQDILTNTPSVIVDDRLQGIVPYLPLTGADAAAGHAPAPPAVLHPGTSTGSGAPQQ